MTTCDQAQFRLSPISHPSALHRQLSRVGIAPAPLFGGVFRFIVENHTLGFALGLGGVNLRFALGVSLSLALRVSGDDLIRFEQSHDLG
jgi:hypothetical protein